MEQIVKRKAITYFIYLTHVDSVLSAAESVGVCYLYFMLCAKNHGNSQEDRLSETTLL